MASQPTQLDQLSEIPSHTEGNLKQYKLEIEALIAKYEDEIIKLPQLNWDGPAPSCLTMKVSDLRKVGPHILAEFAFEITQYSLYIQRCVNREHSWLTWAKSKLDEYSANELANTDPQYGWNGRLLIAKNKPELCRVINTFISGVQMKIDRLQYIPKELDRMSEIIMRISFLAQKKESSYGKEQEN